MRTRGLTILSEYYIQWVLLTRMSMLSRLFYWKCGIRLYIFIAVAVPVMHTGTILFLYPVGGKPESRTVQIYPVAYIHGLQTYLHHSTSEQFIIIKHEICISFYFQVAGAIYIWFRRVPVYNNGRIFYYYIRFVYGSWQYSYTRV